MNIDIELITDILLWKHNLLMVDVYDCVVDSYEFVNENDVYDYETIMIHYRFRNVSNNDEFVDDVYMLDIQDYKNLQRQKRLKNLGI